MPSFALVNAKAVSDAKNAFDAKMQLPFSIDIDIWDIGYATDHEQTTGQAG